MRSQPFACGVAAVCIALFASAGLCAETATQWPTKPVLIVGTSTAGGSGDILARLLSQGLSEHLGRQFVVENRPGAAGNIGADTVAKAAPDGYTFALTTSGPLANNKYLYKSMPYDPEKNLAPVILLGEIPLVLVVNPSVPANNLDEFVKLAREHPDKMTVAHPGTGTIGHLALELINTRSKVSLVPVPYKGETPALMDVIGGAVQADSSPITSLIPSIKGGKVRALAVFSKKRFPGLPEVPTAIEQGFDIDASVWFALVGPAGVPKDIIDKLNREVARILQLPDTQAKLDQFALVVAGGSPDRLKTLMASDSAKWKQVIDDAKIEAQ
jgi:tripartite-type tricarboxylate transporter receptor subunit TctC